jgi:hypothetical protein
MANIFLNLPMPVGDGAGASVNTLAMGGEKTIVIGGQFVGVNIAVEASTNGTDFQSVASFRAAGKQVIIVAAQFMRVAVVGRSGLAFSATANMGANDAGALFFALPVPANDGPGTPVDVSTLGNFTTFVVGGSFQGAKVAVQISEDGVDYADCASFIGQAGVMSKVLVADWMRTFVSGHDGNALPFTPVVSVGATVDAGGGGGGGGITIPHIITTGVGGTTSLDAAFAAVVIGHVPLGAGTVADVSVGAGRVGFAMGSAEPGAGDTAEIQVNSAGSTSMGRISGGGGGIKTTGSGSFAQGRCYDGGQLLASASGAFAQGNPEYAGSTITASGRGSMARGWTAYGKLLATAPGSTVMGAASSSVPTAQGRILAYGNGSFASGRARAQLGGSIASIEAENYGDVSLGYAASNGSGGKARIYSAGFGSMARGYAGHNDTTLNWESNIEASGYGSFASGHIYGSGVLFARLLADGTASHAMGDVYNATLRAEGTGCFAQGRSYGNSTIKSTGSGSQAIGAAFDDAYIRAANLGSCARGYANGVGAEITSYGDGSMALGKAQAGSTINTASFASGAFAGGSALNGFDIRANGKGSFAFGRASAADVVAGTINSVQFGEGTNAVADSLQVGTGFQARATGQFGGVNVPVTLGVAATTFATGSNLMTVTGDAGSNTVATITGGFSGQEMSIIFADALVTITDDASGALNTINLSAAFTSAANTVLTLLFNGTSWYEKSRSVN